MGPMATPEITRNPKAVGRQRRAQDPIPGRRQRHAQPACDLQSNALKRNAKRRGRRQSKSCSLFKIVSAARHLLFEILAMPDLPIAERLPRAFDQPGHEG